MNTKTRNEAAERLHNRADWRVEQEPAYLLRVDKADGRLDSLSRADFNDLLDEALAAERRATVERIRAAVAAKSGAYDWNATEAAAGAEIHDNLFTILDEEAAR